jgi:hypothetical protein
VAEIETEEQATQVLDGWARSDGSLPEYLCLVELHAHDGAILGTETTIRIRPLP